MMHTVPNRKCENPGNNILLYTCCSQHHCSFSPHRHWDLYGGPECFLWVLVFRICCLVTNKGANHPLYWPRWAADWVQHNNARFVKRRWYKLMTLVQQNINGLLHGIIWHGMRCEWEGETSAVHFNKCVCVLLLGGAGVHAQTHTHTQTHACKRAHARTHTTFCFLLKRIIFYWPISADIEPFFKSLYEYNFHVIE